MAARLIRASGHWKRRRASASRLAAFNPYTAWRNVPAPMHLAAADAYRDCGYLD